MTSPPIILMLGPSVTSPGGIAAVVQAYQKHGLFQTWPIRYVSTTCQGSSASKFMVLLRALATTLAYMCTGKVGLLHIHSASHHSFWRKSLFMILAYCFGKPVVLHLHGGAFLSFYSQMPVLIRSWCIQPLLTHVDTLIVLSQKWKDALATISPAIPVRVIGNPIEVSPEHHRTFEQKPVPVILFMGRLEQAKGIWDLLEACASLAQRGYNFKLVCAGPGNKAEAYSRALQLHLDQHLVLPGWVEGETKHYWLSEATMLVLPSYFEGLPVTLLEAMAYRLPVIATAVGGIPDVIVSGENGVLIRPGDISALTEEIVHLMESPQHRKQWGTAAFKTACRNYSPPQVLSLLSDTYRKCGITPVAVPATTTFS